MKTCKYFFGGITILAGLVAVGGVDGVAQAPASDVKAATVPVWAYPVTVRAPRPAAAAPPPATTAATPAATRPVDESLRHVPGSTAGYTKKFIGDLFTVPDWFPEAHAPMPEVVSQGRKPEIGACGHCHLPNGLGRPENESVAGLPAAYMLQQIEDFKSGARKSSEPQLASVTNMIRAAQAATPEEMKAGVAYFAAMKRTPWIRVVETDMVPKTRVSSLMLMVEPGAEKEPIGSRVIEVSEDLEQTELRNPTSGFVAYVPKGSLKVGEDLVKTGGNGKTLACTMCHGPNLQGMGAIPSIAGRSPSQMARQLFDFQSGARNGSGAAMMKMPVAKLTEDDVVAITGYLASLQP